MEGSVYLAEYQLHTAQRAGRPIMDGTARFLGDQTKRRSELEGDSVFQKRQLQCQGPSPSRRLRNGSRVSW